MIDIERQAEPLHDLVEMALRTSPFLPQRKVRIEAHDGHVTLRGRVGSFYQKQMAQEAVRGIDGVDLVSNHLEVE